MSDEYEPAYSELQSEPDNIEIIRDQIAALLAIDLNKQHEIAMNTLDPNDGDYDVAVYVENDDPLQYVDDATPGANPFPCVNVSLDSCDDDKGTASVNRQCWTAQFYIDCYATGNTASDEDFGTKAALKAWKTARLVRRILRAEPNTYLRLRGVVGKVGFKFQSGEPNNPRGAIRVKMVRITLSVDYVEDVEISQGVIDWEIVGIVTDETGRVILR
ncbi:MAG: hypothetical protein IJP62_13910 [Treponema sp.]|nr:hypothetical protein [Treponema sp.]